MTIWDGGLNEINGVLNIRLRLHRSWGGVDLGLNGCTAHAAHGPLRKFKNLPGAAARTSYDVGLPLIAPTPCPYQLLNMYVTVSLDFHASRWIHWRWVFFKEIIRPRQSGSRRSLDHMISEMREII